MLAYIPPDHAEYYIDKYLVDCPFANTLQEEGTELPELLQSEGYKQEHEAVASSRAMLGRGSQDLNQAFVTSPSGSAAAAERDISKSKAVEAFGVDQPTRRVKKAKADEGVIDDTSLVSCDKSLIHLVHHTS